MVVDHADTDRVVVAVDRDVVQEPGWAGDPTEAKPASENAFDIDPTAIARSERSTTDTVVPLPR